MLTEPGLITVREAAVRLRCGRKRIYALIDAGTVGAVKIGGRWHVLLADVEGLRHV